MKELTVEITDKCSLNCLMCSTLAKPRGKKHISLKKFSNILDKYHDFNVVRLSGGEPFEHPDLRGLLKITKMIDSKKKTNILSCGVKNNRPVSADYMEKISPFTDEITFSYHGYYSAHDRIITSNKPFHMTYTYWDMLLDSADNAYSRGIPISFQTVLLCQNFNKLESIARDMTGLKSVYGKDVNWHILRFVKQGRGKMHANQALTDEQISELPEIVEGLRKKYGINITYTHSFDHSGCDCGSKKAVVTISGKEIPCSALKDIDSPKKQKYACEARV